MCRLDGIAPVLLYVRTNRIWLVPVGRDSLISCWVLLSAVWLNPVWTLLDLCPICVAIIAWGNEVKLVTVTAIWFSPVVGMLSTVVIGLSHESLWAACLLAACLIFGLF